MASLNPISGILGKRLAAHLLRRSTYAPTKQNIDIYAAYTITEAMNALMIVPALTPNHDEPIDWQIGGPFISTGANPVNQNGGDRWDYLRGWWFYEALKDNGISHKMEFFWFNQFTITLGINDGSVSDAYDYLRYLKHYALGNFKTLAYKITLSNNMLDFLDGNVNEGDNENYAREFLELYTIGEGPQVAEGNYTNYTDADIVEASKIFSGFRQNNNRTILDTDTGLPMGYPTLSRHDSSTKTFSAAFQSTTITGATNTTEMFTEIWDFMDMVFDQEETAKNLCRKLYHYFVSRNITAEVESDIITPLATQLYGDGYEVENTLRILLSSEHFFDTGDGTSGDEVFGSLIKSPFELLMQAINLFELDVPHPVNDSETYYQTFYMGWVHNNVFGLQNYTLFTPDLVAGYPSYYQKPYYTRFWFNSSTIILRYKLPEMFLTGTKALSNASIGTTAFNPVTWIETHCPTPINAYTVIQTIAEYAFCELPDSDRTDYYLNVGLLNGLPIQDWVYEWQAYEAGGSELEVKLMLSGLFTAMLYSPEYQLI